MRKLAASALVVMAVTRVGAACQCGWSPLAKEFETSDVVVLATVSSVDDSYNWWRRFKLWLGVGPDPGALEYTDSMRLYGFRANLVVERSYKGAAGRTAAVITGRGGGDCGYFFQVGMQYLVFANKLSDGQLFTSMCHRTAPASRAGVDRDALEKMVHGH